MAELPNIATLTGLFWATTPGLDTSIIQNAESGSPEYRNFIVRLATILNEHGSALNMKTSGLFTDEIFQTGQVYDPVDGLGSIDAPLRQRPVFRKVVNFGVLPNAGVQAIPHNVPVTDTYTFVHLYGAATDPVGLTSIPIPNSDVNLRVTATEVEITTTADFTNYTRCYVVLEYLTII